MTKPYAIYTVTSERDLTFALALRAIVFIDEQSCPFTEEFDDFDTLENRQVTHFLIKDHEEPVATARIIYTDKTHAKIGRIAVLNKYRNQGLATALIKHMLLSLTLNRYTHVSIHAQIHLEKYYEQFDFLRSGETFEEAGILHIKMYKLVDIYPH